MQTTKNYGFKKPASTDFYNVEDMNFNSELIDEKLKESEESISTVSTALSTHTKDTTGHITSAERTNWNNKLDATATATNSNKLGGLDSNAYATLASLIYSGLMSNDLADISIGEVYTFQQLCDNHKITFFTNWLDKTNFPDQFGSGIMFPCLDASHRLIFYTGAVNSLVAPYIGKVDKEDGVWRVVWRSTSDSGDADTLDGLHASNFIQTTGGRIANAENAPLIIENTNGTPSVIDYYSKGVYLGGMGFYEEGVPALFKNGIHSLLHTGNSVKVIISDTAPADTTALWIS